MKSIEAFRAPLEEEQPIQGTGMETLPPVNMMPVILDYVQSTNSGLVIDSIQTLQSIADEQAIDLHEREPRLRSDLQQALDSGERIVVFDAYGNAATPLRYPREDANK